MFTPLKSALNHARYYIPVTNLFKYLIISVMADPIFPKTLKEFGYAFDQGGKLRKLDSTTGLITEQGFEFNVSDDLSYNQKRYEDLGQIIDEYVYELLEKDGLIRLTVPKIAEKKTLVSGKAAESISSFVFGTEDFCSKDKLMVLIHGSGVVRAGQWARRLIINDNIKSGTQLPYIQKARELGYGILVLNTNDNTRNVGGSQNKETRIPGSEDPHNHMETVWKDYIEPSKAKHIAIVAHSYGGVCVIKFALKHPKEFRNRVFAVGLTDSVHTIPTGNKNTADILKVARNWVSSEKPLDTPERTPDGDIERFSAGHSTHEMTSYSCIDSLFRFVENRYNDHVMNKKTDL